MTSKLTQLAEQKTAAQVKSLSVESYRWLQNKITQLRNPGAIPKQIAREKDRFATRFKLGGLYFFFYDPKTKSELPYYDTFPLVLVLERYADGFLGLNLHYLPVKYRIAFLNKLMPLALLDDSDEIKRIRVTYDILSASRRYKEFRPCVKKYLYGHMRSRLLTVQPNEWDVASMIPVQQFKKARTTQIWHESIEQIRNN
jgi:hypothetical protein